MAKNTASKKETEIKINLDEILTDTAHKAFEDWINKRYTR